MKPFSDIELSQAQKLRYVLCDIDDTITTDGKLPPESYTALWRLHDAGYRVIPVTGRPAGWCDLIVRQWPVTAVVGENGAFVYYFKDGHRLTFTHPSVAGGDIQGRLAAVRDACLAGVPGCRVSKDQFARIYDVAIDFNEDPPYLGFEAADKIKEIAESLGAVANLVIFDPDEEWTIDPEQFASKARNTPFAGWKVKGKVKYTIARGEVIYQDS